MKREPECEIDPGRLQRPATPTNLPLPQNEQVLSITAALFRPNKTSLPVRDPDHDMIAIVLQPLMGVVRRRCGRCGRQRGFACLGDLVRNRTTVDRSISPQSGLRHEDSRDECEQHALRCAAYWRVLRFAGRNAIAHAAILAAASHRDTKGENSIAGSVFLLARQAISLSIELPSRTIITGRPVLVWYSLVASMPSVR
jgi:hypothetical protein